MTTRETATILAALRLWQETTNRLESLPGQTNLKEIATNCGKVEPLNDEEIDSLCEAINLPDETSDDPAADLLGELMTALQDLKQFGGDGGTEAEGKAQIAFQKTLEFCE